jgi:hyperosmotically inducible periplasmic protein
MISASPAHFAEYHRIMRPAPDSKRNARSWFILNQQAFTTALCHNPLLVWIKLKGEASDKCSYICETTGMELMKKLNSLGAAAWLAVAGMVGLVGCTAGDRYNQSTGEHIDDAATTGRVKSALGNDSMFKYPDVSVTTFKGTVQLSGFVDKREQKSRAETLAKNEPGVKDVVNNISVKE